MILKALTLLLVLAVGFGRVHSGVLPNKSISALEIHRSLERVFKAIEEVLVFYKKQYKNLIVDGVYGLRVLEGTVNIILKEARNGEIQLSERNKARATKLATKASQIAKESIPWLKKQDIYYFNMMGFTVTDPWENIKPLKNLNLKDFIFPTRKYKKQYPMEEEAQDKCFNALTGIKRGTKPCTITEDCWKVNSELRQGGYHLTHQILYFLLGEVKGCSNVFESRFKADAFTGGTEKFYSISCHAMYPEIQKQEETAIKSKQLGEIDLYMEQAVVCGMIGYADYFSIKRLDRILKWRHPDGCFGYTKEVHGDDDENNQKSDDDEGKVTMRKLKVSKDLKGGCEVHSTGVGTGLFALYLRWLLHLSSKQPTSYESAAKHYPIPVSDSTLTVLILIIVVIIILLMFSKRMGLRFHRNKYIKKLFPFI